MRESNAQPRKMPHTRQRSHMNRKGQLEVPVNWVFIMIAGGIILVSFFAFIQKQKSANELSVAESLVADLSAIASGAQTAKGTAQLIEFPEETIEFSCEQCDCNFRIGPVTRQFGDNLIFGPTQIVGPNLVLYAVAWNAPFRVTNFLIATNSRTKYIFAIPTVTPETQRIMALIPDNINRENFTGAAAEQGLSMRNPGGKTRIVYMIADRNTGGCSPNMQETEDQDVSCINVYLPSRFMVFFKKDKRGNMVQENMFGAYGGQHYTTDADLLAAIFTEDPQQYGCNMREAYYRLATLSDIYSARARTFDSDTTLCSMSYDRPVTALNDLAKESRKAVNATITFGLVDKLSNLSQEYIRKSCPEIY